MGQAHPLIVSITDLMRHPGSRRELQRHVELDGLAISTASVPPGGQTVVDLVIESQSSSLSVSGTVSVPWVGECRRCLADVEGVATAEVKEIFERRPTEGETYPMADDFVDLEPMVRDAALLNLPLAPLCGPDCLGPAPESFPATVESDPVAGGPADADADELGADREAAGPPPDPRWAALDQLKFD